MSIHALGGLEEWQRVHRIDLNEATLMYWSMFLEDHGRNIDTELAGCTTKLQVIEKMESLITELA
jgi:hypothetical protein